MIYCESQVIYRETEGNSKAYLPEFKAFWETVKAQRLAHVVVGKSTNNVVASNLKPCFRAFLMHQNMQIVF